MNTVTKNTNVTSSVIAFFFFGAIISASAWATYGFAVTFVPDFAPEFFGPLRTIASGVVTVILADIAALVWQYLRVNHASSERQMQIAGEQTRFTIYAAISLTVVFLLLTNYGLVELAGLRQVVGIIGIALLVGVFGFQMYRVWAYIEADPAVYRKERESIEQAEIGRDTVDEVITRARNNRNMLVTQAADAVYNDWVNRTVQSAQDGFRPNRNRPAPPVPLAPQPLARVGATSSGVRARLRPRVRPNQPAGGSAAPNEARPGASTFPNRRPNANGTGD